MWRDGELPVAANLWSLKHAHREGIVTAELDREVLDRGSATPGSLIAGHFSGFYP